MWKRLSLLIAMASMVIMLFALNPDVASANPGNGGDGIENAKDQLGEDPPAYSNGQGDGGLWGNPATADSEEGFIDHGTGADAMLMQVLHNPICSAHPAH